MACIHIVDNHRLAREALVGLFSEGEFDVVGQSATIDDMLDTTVRNSAAPEIVLIWTKGFDSTLQGGLRALFERLPDCKIVVLGFDLTSGAVGQALAAGVHGILDENIPSKVLMASLNLVLAGERVLPSELFCRSLAAMQRPSSEAALCTRHDRAGIEFSERERDILRLLVDGASNKVIAIKLDLAEATIKVHLRSILRKIGVDNRTQAAVWAINNGFSDDVLLRAS